MARNDGTPVNLLALDGGGIRGICELRVLDEIMKRVQKEQNLSSLPRPCDYFHLMAGTSTGGLVAILLSQFKMTTKDAIEAYYSFSSRIFSKKNKQYRKSYFVGHEFGEAVLEQIIKEMVVEHKIGDLMLDPQPSAQSKAFVCSQQAHQQGIPVRFRTYEPPQVVRNPSLDTPSSTNTSSPSSPSPSTSPSTDMSLASRSSKEGDTKSTTAATSDPWNEYRDIQIWEAARATTAAPSFFPPMVLSRGGHTRTFIDGAMGCNNPVYELIDEATALFGTDCTLGCLVSLGTGFSGPLTIGVRTGIKQKLDLLLNVKKLATDTETPHENLRRQIRAERDAYFRFQLPSGAEKIGLHQYEKLDELSQLMQAYIEQESSEIDKVVQILVGNLKPQGVKLGEIARSDHGQICPPKKDIRGKPQVSEFFTGREDVLRSLAEAFRPDPNRPNLKRHHLLYGQPGAGKSHTASKFLDDYSHWFEMIFWVDAVCKETLEGGFKQLKEACSEHGYVGDGSAKSIMRWLEVTEKSWILVLDDVRGDVSGYIPQGNRGAVLFTSQNKHMKPVQKSTTMLDVMSEEDAVNLLIFGAQIEEEDAGMREEAAKLAASLAHLPLTLEQAATTLRIQKYKISEYAKLLEDRHHNLLKNNSDSDNVSRVLQAVHASFDVTYKVLNTQAHDTSKETEAEAAKYAVQLLNLFSFYHNEGLMGGILKRAAENHPEDRRQDDFGAGVESFADLLATDESGKWIEYRWQLGIDLLIAYSLIKVIKDNQGRKLYSMHGLMHDWARERMPEYLRCIRAKAARIILFDSIDESRSITSDILYSFRIIPHADAVIEHTESIDIDKLLVAEQYYRFGLALYAAELNFYAYKYLIDAYAIMHSHTGIFCERTITMGESVAESARRQGLVKGTFEFSLKLLEARQRMFGIGDLSSLRALTKCCIMAIELGEFDHLEVMLRVSIKEFFGMYTTEEQLATKTALAVLLYHSGQFDEASDIFSGILQEANAKLGRSHPDTLKAINNLSIVRTRLGDYEGAEEMLKRLAEAEEAIFGPCHVGRASTLHNLAAVYFYQGRFEEALKLFKEARDLTFYICGGYQATIMYHIQGHALAIYCLGNRRYALKKIDRCCRALERHLTAGHIFTKEVELQRDAWRDEEARGIPIQPATISRVIPMFRL
ncbi:hypothetical protein M434DRAFT_391527 [Hypoxylon sp. CO27-5]|nr:hypothetical protein M434DRAFT_391527 [Hypoxylon sp. CO27-5]